MLVPFTFTLKIQYVWNITTYLDSLNVHNLSKNQRLKISWVFIERTSVVKLVSRKVPNEYKLGALREYTLVWQEIRRSRNVRNIQYFHFLLWSRKNEFLEYLNWRPSSTCCYCNIHISRAFCFDLKMKYMPTSSGKIWAWDEYFKKNNRTFFVHLFN